MPDNDIEKSRPALLAECRAGFLATLEEFARDLGYAQPDSLDGLRSEAGAAFDELAGLKDRAGFEMAASLTASRISLVHEEDLEFSIVLTDVARRMRERCEQALARVHGGMRRLLDQRDTTSEQCPVGPEAACRGLRGLAEAADLDPERRLRLVSDGADELAGRLEALYRQLEARFEQAGLVLSKRSRAAPPTAGADPDATSSQLAALRSSFLPTADSERIAGTPALPGELLALIHQWLARQGGDARPAQPTAPPSDASLADLLAPERAAAVLAVERAFDAIASEPELAPGLRIALGRLQIPLVKLALQDDALLTQPDHPANRLMRGMAQACAGIPLEDFGESRWARQVDRIAGTLQRADGDLGEALAEAMAATEQLLAERLDAIRAVADEVRELAQRSERQDRCLAAASKALRTMLGPETPGQVGDLLELYWVQVLARCLYSQGTESAEYQGLLETASELVRSVSAIPEAAERRQLVTRLPALISRLQAGLDRLGIDSARRNAALAPCMDLHSALIRGAAIPAYRRAAGVGLRLRAVAGTGQPRVLMHGGYTAEDLPPADWIRALEVGDRVQLEQPDLGCWQGSVGAVGAQRQVVTLVPDGASGCLLVTVRALAELALAASARLEPIASPLEMAAHKLMQRAGG